MGEPAEENDVPDVQDDHRVSSGVGEDSKRFAGDNLLDSRPRYDPEVCNARRSAVSMKCRIYFADEQVQEAFLALQASQAPEDRQLTELAGPGSRQNRGRCLLRDPGAEEVDSERLPQEMRTAEESLEV